MSNLFVKANVNPKGNKACDCVVRAMVAATNEKWEDIYSVERTLVTLVVR